MYKALIITQIGLNIGLGHLTRSIAIARAMRDAGDFEVSLKIFGHHVSRDDLTYIKHEFVFLHFSLQW